jgi:hypothetical protein
MKRSFNLQPSKLRSLPADQREQLVRWLVQDKFSYHVILQLLRERFGVVGSSAGLSRFWQRECAPALAIRNGALTVNIRVFSGGAVIAEDNLELGSQPAGRLIDQKLVEALEPLTPQVQDESNSI